MFEQQWIDNNIVQFSMARRMFTKNLYKVSCYYADGLLIDTGSSFFDCQLLDRVRPLSLHTIVNTHCHEDHIGGNHLLQKRLGPDIYAHPEAIPVLADPALLSLRKYQKVFFGSPLPSTAKAVERTIQTDRFSFEVVHTPGHSPDHISLFERKKGWLICGDAFIGGREKVFRCDYDIGGIVQTYQLILSLPVSILFTGSGKIIPKPRDAIKRKLAYFEEVIDNVIHLQSQGKNKKQIARELFGDDRTIRMVTSGHFSGAHLVHSILNRYKSLKKWNHQ